MYLCITDPGGIQFFPFTQSIQIQAPLVPQLNFDRKKMASSDLIITKYDAKII